MCLCVRSRWLAALIKLMRLKCHFAVTTDHVSPTTPLEPTALHKWFCQQQKNNQWVKSMSHFKRSNLSALFLCCLHSAPVVGLPLRSCRELLLLLKPFIFPSPSSSSSSFSSSSGVQSLKLLPPPVWLMSLFPLSYPLLQWLQSHLNHVVKRSVLIIGKLLRL